jgi:hypothetical protein
MVIGTDYIGNYKSNYHTIMTTMAPILQYILRRGFAPGFVNYIKGCTRLTAASDKVYQLRAHGRWFYLGTPASSTTKTDIFHTVSRGIHVVLITFNHLC